MAEIESIPWLVVILRQSLTLAWADQDLGPGFTAQGTLFEAVSDNDLSGFYDRLYGEGGSFVGLQIAPLVCPDLPQRLDGLSYARAANSGLQLQIFFGQAVPTRVTEVADQAFGGRMYASLSGEFALSLDTYFLDEAERRHIAATDVEWVELRPLGA